MCFHDFDSNALAHDVSQYANVRELLRAAGTEQDDIGFEGNGIAEIRYAQFRERGRLPVFKHLICGNNDIALNSAVAQVNRTRFIGADLTLLDWV